MTCSNGGQVATPLIIVSSIIGLIGGVAAYNYKYNYDAIMTYYTDRKEQLYLQMNQWTMVVSRETGRRGERDWEGMRMCV